MPANARLVAQQCHIPQRQLLHFQMPAARADQHPARHQQVAGLGFQFSQPLRPAFGIPEKGHLLSIMPERLPPAMGSAGARVEPRFGRRAVLLHNSHMIWVRRSLLLALNVAALAGALCQSPPPVQTGRPTPPTRDPHTPGYVSAKELPDGGLRGDSALG